MPMSDTTVPTTSQTSLQPGDQGGLGVIATPRQLDQIRAILWQHLEQKKTKAFVFGSQATKNTWRGSDLDIGVEGQVTASQLAKVREALEESTLPYTIDVVNFNQMGPEFITQAKTKTIAL